MAEVRAWLSTAGMTPTRWRKKIPKQRPLGKQKRIRCRTQKKIYPQTENMPSTGQE